MNNVFVYGWYDGEEIFYVGVAENKEQSLTIENRTNLTMVCRQTAETWQQFGVYVLYAGLTWARAIEIQRQMILKYGRRFNGTGVLTNETTGNDYEIVEPKDIQFVFPVKKRKADRTVRTPHSIYESVAECARAYKIKPSEVKKLVDCPNQYDWQYLSF